MARRRATAGLAAALAVGFAALLLAGALAHTHQVQTLGVLPVYPIAPLERGQLACQHDVTLAEPIDGVHFNAGAFGAKAGPVAVTIRAKDGRLLGSGRPPGDLRQNGPRELAVGRIDSPAPLTVCLRNLGATKTYIFGDSFTESVRDGFPGVRPTLTPGFATREGRRLGDGDLSLVFTSRESRSRLARLPAVFEHAAHFRPGFVGAWTFWLLLALAAVAAPLLLLRAVRRAVDEDDRVDAPAPEPPPADAPEPERERVPASSSR